MENRSGEELFYAKVSKPLVWFVIGISAIFGGSFLASAVRAYPRIDGITIGFFLLAVGFFYVAWRVYCFSLFPRVKLSNRTIQLNRAFGCKIYSLNEVGEFARFTKVLKGYDTGERKIPTRYFFYFVIRLRDGVEAKFVLPEFEGEKDLIEAVEKIAKRQVTILPDLVK